MSATKNFLVVLTATLSLLPSISSAQVASLSETVNICAMMRAREGKRAELRDALKSLATSTRNDKGYVAYQAYEEESGALFLHEVWRSRDDLNRHLEKPDVQDFVNKVPERLNGKNDAHFGRAVYLSEKPQVSRGTDSIGICSVKRPKTGKADELRSALLSLTAPTIREPGNLVYNIYEEEDGSIFLFETWRSRADLERHFGMPYVTDFRSKLDGLVDVNEVHIGKPVSN